MVFFCLKITILSNLLKYKPNDIFNARGIICPAYITGSKRSLYLSVTTDKSLKDITSFTVVGGAIRIRQNGNYLYGTSSAIPILDLPSNTLTFTKGSGNSIIVYFYFDVADTNATNNDVCSVYFDDLQIKLS